MCAWDVEILNVLLPSLKWKTLAPFFFNFNFNFFWSGLLLLLPKLECSGTFSAHCNFCFPDWSDSLVSASWVARITGARHHARLIFVFLLEIGFCHIGQVGLKLLTSGDVPTPTSQSAGITGVCHHAQLTPFCTDLYSCFCFLFFWGRVSLCHPSWSTVTQILADCSLHFLG